MVGRPTEVPLTVALAIEFLNTHAPRPDGGVDLIDSGDTLVSWMLLVKLIDAAAAERVLDETAPETLDEIAAEARELRAWFRNLVVRRHGHWLATEILAESSRLNSLLSAGETFSTIIAAPGAGGSPLRLRSIRRLRSARGLLALLAELLARYLCDGYLICVKSCADPDCAMLFADFSCDGVAELCGVHLCPKHAPTKMLGSEGRCGCADEGACGS